jgi:membrane associated rhomboid family serine protease
MRMSRGTQQPLSLPPFTPAVTWLIVINTAVLLALEIAGISIPKFAVAASLTLELIPRLVMHGWVWQIVTYSFLHVGFAHWFFNMLALWMFGTQIEGIRGPRYFLELFFAGVVGGALFCIGLSYSGVLGSPDVPTVGASAGIYAVLMAFGIFFAENEIILFPFPIQIKAKYLVAILIVVSLALSLQGGGSISHIGHLGGLVLGYLFVKFVPRRGMGFEVSEGFYAGRNFYHRWKRRRASKKFQVYMREQGRDTKGYMDEQGNFLSPGDTNDKKDDKKDRGDWVN